VSTASNIITRKSFFSALFLLSILTVCLIHQNTLKVNAFISLFSTVFYQNSGESSCPQNSTLSVRTTNYSAVQLFCALSEQNSGDSQTGLQWDDRIAPQNSKDEMLALPVCFVGERQVSHSFINKFRDSIIGLQTVK
jgi:hypothetical protein